MREYLFKAKTLRGGIWVYGSLVEYVAEYEEPKYETRSQFEIFTKTGAKYEVIPETIGQFTGKHDKNYVRIFVGDLVKSKSGEIMQVVFEGTRFVMKKKNKRPLTWQYVADCEVVGNIHDNPNIFTEVNEK